MYESKLQMRIIHKLQNYKTNLKVKNLIPLFFSSTQMWIGYPTNLSFQNQI